MKIVILNIFIALTSTILFPIFISDETLLFSNSIYSLLFFAVVYYILEHESKIIKTKKELILTHLLGAIFAFFEFAGKSLDTYQYISYIKLVPCIIIYSHIIASIISIFWRKIDSFNCGMCSSDTSIINKILEFINKKPIVLFIFLILCWVPCLIADFPGGFRYDATAELEQINNGFNSAFPFLHSFIITKLLPLSKQLFGTYDYGVTFYVVIQMVLLSLIYTKIITYFNLKIKNKIVIMIIILYCAFSPIVQMLVVQEVRDVLFSVLLTYSIFLLYLMENEEKYFFNNFKLLILFVFVFPLTILSRNNNIGIGSLVLLLILSTYIWIKHKKNHFKNASILSICIIIVYALFSVLLSLYCQPVVSSGKYASLTAINQPIIRTFVNGEMNEDEISEFNKYLTIDSNSINYCAENGDSTKWVLYTNGDTKGFITFWVRTGLKHLDTYLDAILQNTQNMWYPSSVIDGYNQLYTKKGQPYYEYEKCYFSFTDSNADPISHKNYFPKLLNYYENIGLYISFEKIPILSMFFSIGFQFWLCLNCLFYLINKNKTKLLLPIIVILAYMIISSFTPLVILRYFAAVFLSIPIVIGIHFIE